VPEVQDFDDFFGRAVHNDVRRANELAGSRHLSGSAKAGEARELFNPFDNRMSDTLRSRWVVFPDVFNSRFNWSDVSVVHRMSLTSEIAGRFG
jgi:hypothetical protein